MSQLFFKKQFHAAILDGTKRTTIRRWPRPRVVAGRDAYILRIGWVSIRKVEAVELTSLGDEDARADGFANRQIMLQTLNEIYPAGATDGKQWFRITFELRDTSPAPRQQFA